MTDQTYRSLVLALFGDSRKHRLNAVHDIPSTLALMPFTNSVFNLYGHTHYLGHDRCGLLGS